MKSISRSRSTISSQLQDDFRVRFQFAVSAASAMLCKLENTSGQAPSAELASQPAV